MNDKANDHCCQIPERGQFLTVERQQRGKEISQDMTAIIVRDSNRESTFIAIPSGYV